MLTFAKQIFVWWNQATIGTRLKTIFFGNKYYQNKSGNRWVIYKDEIDASKIPNEWFSWIHFTKNKIENVHEFQKYDWQKPHQPNQTGTDNSYHPNKYNEKKNKKYKSWKK